MSAFNAAWNLVKEDSDCVDVMDLMDSHGLSLMEAVRAFVRINGMSRKEGSALFQACQKYRDSEDHESANLKERMSKYIEETYGDGQQ